MGLKAHLKHVFKVLTCQEEPSVQSPRPIRVVPGRGLLGNHEVTVIAPPRLVEVRYVDAATSPALPQIIAPAKPSAPPLQDVALPGAVEISQLPARPVLMPIPEDALLQTWMNSDFAPPSQTNLDGTLAHTNDLQRLGESTVEWQGLRQSQSYTNVPICY